MSSLLVGAYYYLSLHYKDVLSRNNQMRILLRF